MDLIDYHKNTTPSTPRYKRAWIYPAVMAHQDILIPDHSAEPRAQGKLLHTNSWSQEEHHGVGSAVRERVW